jgi:hypothetical protein
MTSVLFTAANGRHLKVVMRAGELVRSELQS